MPAGDGLETGMRQMDAPVLINIENSSGRGHAEILISRASTDREIYFILRQPHSISKEKLAALVLGVGDYGS